MPPPTPTEAAASLAAAREERRTLSPLTDTWADLEEEWGYAAQLADRARREARGEHVIGAKLGLTSSAKQQRMGIARPIAGFLTDAMALGSRQVGQAVLTHWRQPRIEPEIAFVTASDIRQPLRWEQVPSVIASVGLAAEIIDSGWTDYRFRLADVLADNTSAAGLLTAAPLLLSAAGDLAGLPCAVRVDGQLVHEATGAAILGHPLRAVEWLSAHLAQRGEVLPAGSLILAGALTDAVPLTPGHRYELEIRGLGSLEVVVPAAHALP